MQSTGAQSNTTPYRSVRHATKHSHTVRQGTAYGGTNAERSTAGGVRMTHCLVLVALCTARYPTALGRALPQGPPRPRTRPAAAAAFGGCPISTGGRSRWSTCGSTRCSRPCQTPAPSPSAAPRTSPASANTRGSGSGLSAGLWAKGPPVPPPPPPAQCLGLSAGHKHVNNDVISGRRSGEAPGQGPGPRLMAPATCTSPSGTCSACLFVFAGDSTSSFVSCTSIVFVLCPPSFAFCQRPPPPPPKGVLSECRGYMRAQCPLLMARTSQPSACPFPRSLRLMAPSCAPPYCVSIPPAWHGCHWRGGGGCTVMGGGDVLGGVWGGGVTDIKNRQMQTRGNALQNQAYVHLYSLCQTWLNLKTHTVSETENRTSCLTTLVRQSQSVAVSQTSAISVGRGGGDGAVVGRWWVGIGGVVRSTGWAN